MAIVYAGTPIYQVIYTKPNGDQAVQDCVGESKLKEAKRLLERDNRPYTVELLYHL